MSDGDRINCRQFISYINTQLPYFDAEIVRDVRPADGYMGYYETGTFEAQTGTEHTFDRFRHVYPNLTHQWNEVATQGCNNACDCDENLIGWGWSRHTYKLMKQCWATALLCFDELLTKTKAKEHLAYIISDILRPATNLIMSDFLMRNAYEAAESKVVVTNDLPPFNITWDAGGYAILNTSLDNGVTPGPDPTGIITPQILQSFVRKQYMLGATKAGEEGYDALEFHTDVDTFRSLTKDDPYLKSQWAFQEWGANTDKYYKYGLSGKVGDFVVKVNQFPWRFNKIGPGKYRRVMPYTNVPTTEGIKSIFNEAYDKAQYQISCINNRRAMRVLPFQPQALNPNMPFAVRDYGGRWGFATHDLGDDCNGQAIQNYRQNKGKFFADFQLAVKPEHPEWLVAFFHKVQKPCIVIIAPCQPDPGDQPPQDYNSANDKCADVLDFVATPHANGSYEIAANTAKCNGNVITHTVVGGATGTTTIAALVTQLNTAGKLNGLGTWIAHPTDPSKVRLTATPPATSPTCLNVELPFVTG